MLDLEKGPVNLLDSTRTKIPKLTKNKSRISYTVYNNIFCSFWWKIKYFKVKSDKYINIKNLILNDFNSRVLWFFSITLV